MTKIFRIPLFLLIVTLLVTLCGCSRLEAPVGNIIGTDFSANGTLVDYSLSAQTKELTYNGTRYTFDISYSDNSITYTIYYPNGGMYYETRGSGGGPIGWSDKYEPLLTTPSGEELVEFLSQRYYISHSAPSVVNIVMALICLGVGCFNLFLPEAAWYWAHMFRSWQYESVEPSDAGIVWTRMGGIFIIIMGVIAFFMKWS